MATVTSQSRELSPPRRMTEKEFVQWCTDDTWAEWVDGEVVLMNAIALDHNDLYHFISKLLGLFVEELELGRLLSEPFQLRFAKQRRRRSPDISFVSNARMPQLENNQFNGGPDLIIEVVSPESQTRDRKEKFAEYQAAGVTEYWLADPKLRSFEAYWLNDAGKYELLPLADGAVHSKVLTGIYFRPEWVWQLKLPKVLSILPEMIDSHRNRSSTRKA